GKPPQERQLPPPLPSLAGFKPFLPKTPAAPPAAPPIKTRIPPAPKPVPAPPVPAVKLAPPVILPPKDAKPEIQTRAQEIVEAELNKINPKAKVKLSEPAFNPGINF